MFLILATKCRFTDYIGRIVRFRTRVKAGTPSEFRFIPYACRVCTTKYTMLSFLPRNFLEQFRRVANIYFVFIVLLNWVPAINAFGKEVSVIPIMFVLGVTALKDYFEDHRRFISDRRVNNSTCRVYVR